MREAFARAGLWFFGSILFIIVIGGDTIKDSKSSDGEIIASVVAIAFIVAGAVFFLTWHGYEKEERELKLEERRRALDKSDDVQS